MRPKSFNRYRIVVQEPDGLQWRIPREPVIDTTPRRDDRFIHVNQGDRLDILAHKHLGDARLWWVLAAYNNKFWMGDLTIGEELRVPSYERTVMDILV